MYAKVVWVLVSSGTQVQPQVILDPDYLPDYLPVSYDCLELILARLNAYGLDSRSVYFLSSYLDKRKEITKVNSSYSISD